MSKEMPKVPKGSFDMMAYLTESFEAKNGYKPAIVGGIAPSTGEVVVTANHAIEDARRRVEEAVEQATLEELGGQNG